MFDSPVRLDELPKTIYKYRPVQRDTNGEYTIDEHTLSIITEGSIFFSSARRFNDPFDTAVGYSFDDDPDEAFWYVNRYLKKHRPDLDKKKRRREASQMVDSVLAKGENYLDQVQDVLQKLHYDSFGLFCASSINDDLLMWSHYASDHRGICLGLRKSMLARTAFRVAVQDHRSIEALQVRYSKERAKYPFYKQIGITNEGRKRYLQNIVAYKSDHWAYEREYRLICWYKTDLAVKCGSDLVSEVVLGCRISEQNEKTILDSLASVGSKAKVFRARKHDSRFELVLEEVRE